MSPFLFYLLVIALGVLPSILWLSYWLRQDCHPEPKYLITKAFLLGIILSPLAVIVQRAIMSFVGAVDGTPTVSFYAIAAVIEELVKFLPVYLIIARDPQFDEPVDAMIYLIATALGFAAMENILVMFQVLPNTPLASLTISNVVHVWLLRFIGATFLHALASALVGYAFALSWFAPHHRLRLTVVGLLLASLFHFSFNTFLAHPPTPGVSLTAIAILLACMAWLVSLLFARIRQYHADRIAQLVSANLS